MVSIFLDTYAIFEIIKGSDNYKKYEKNYNPVTTIYNLMELYYNLLLDGATKERAKLYFDTFSEFLVDVDSNTLVDALNFRFENRKKKMSYFDCIGYKTAMKLGIKFLTGDEDFRNVESVEFVKGN